MADARPARKGQLTLAALTCLVFFTTSGGAFAVEPLIGAVGPGLAVALIVVTPLIWSLPMALMVAELATLMPEEGGYYVWVREALGPFWAVQEAWWTMGYTVALLALFPVLFTNYLSLFIPTLAPGPGGLPSAAGASVHWLLSVLVIVTAMVVNLRGAWEVGRSAQVGAAVVLGAFAVLLVGWLVRGPTPNPVGIVVRDLAGDHHGALLLGLSIVLLNYGGWDGAATYAGEVARPQRNYPLAIGLALIAVTLGYLLPVLAGVSVTISPAIWSADAGWPVIARLIGGPWMGGLLAGAGLVSMWTLFNSQLLYVSRLPYVLACDGWFPALFARTSHRTAVPTAAIVMFCGFAAAFAALSFGSLSVIVCLLNIAGLALEFLALIVLRIRRPEAIRPFRVPGGWVGLGLVCLTPLATAVLVLAATMRDWRSYPGQIFVVAMIVVSGIALYPVRKWANRTRGNPAATP